VLRNEFPDLLPELDELEFRAQPLEVPGVLHLNFRRRPLDRRHKQPEMHFQSTRANTVGLLRPPATLVKQLARRYDGSAPDLKRLALEDDLRRGHYFGQFPNALKFIGFERTRTFTFMNSQ
jgi:hypothetical protein